MPMPTAAILGCAGYTGQETLDRVLAHPELEPVALGSDSLAGKPASTLDPRLTTGLPPFVDERGGARGRAPTSSSSASATRRPPRSSRRRRTSSSTSPARTACATRRSIPSGTASSIRAPAPGAMDPRALPPEARLDRESRLLRDRRAARARAARGRGRPGRASSSTRSPASPAPGRGLKASSHAGFVLENLSPYRVGTHQHAPEIEQALGFPVCFVPHLLPVRRGLLVTCYVQPAGDDLRALLEEAYAGSPAVRVLDEGVTARARARAAHRRGRGRAVTRIARRAARSSSARSTTSARAPPGKAVQNANVALGLDETAGLRLRGVLV